MEREVWASRLVSDYFFTICICDHQSPNSSSGMTFVDSSDVFLINTPITRACFWKPFRLVMLQFLLWTVHGLRSHIYCKYIIYIL